ncbi:uncharacterized protein LOC133907595 isoform X1 [Phragmites australis]|uniref:uncharacterized protein LOC133907595 isoform X1 n=1 Tax=Phragmites australis TaxID=29695 RepID=UPI002D7816A4|nr:uncharacterized protein LOC133907595 isoform X1 [Phragmites australis]
MRRWWCAAAGLGRRVLSSSSATRSRPLPPPLIPKDPSIHFPLSCRQHHSLHAPLPQGFFPTSSFRPPVSSPLLPSSWGLDDFDFFSGVAQAAHQQQVRHYANKERSRAPLTPTISKVKKYKLKAPSSMKFRFRTMNDGQIRRWRAGKRHNAHLKSKSAKRRLRKPALVHLAYAKVIKKLNFRG